MAKFVSKDILGASVGNRTVIEMSLGNKKIWSPSIDEFSVEYSVNNTDDIRIISDSLPKFYAIREGFYGQQEVGYKAVKITMNDNSVTGNTGLSTTNVKSIKIWYAEDVRNIDFSETPIKHLLSINMTNIENASRMFYGCTSLESNSALELLDTSNVKFMSSMFEGCSSLTSLNISRWDTSNVTDISHMFDDCTSLHTINVDTWDTSKVTNMGGLFWNCNKLTAVTFMNWDTSNVTSMFGAFLGCSSLYFLGLAGWNTGKVKNAGSIFSGCKSLRNLNLTSFDTTTFESYGGMLSNVPDGVKVSSSKWKLTPKDVDYIDAEGYNEFIYV